MTDILDSDDNNENEDDTEYHSYNNNKKNSKHPEKSNNLKNKKLNNKQDEEEGEGEGEGGAAGANDEAIKLLLKHLASIGSDNKKLDIMLSEMLVNSQKTHHELRSNIDNYLSHEADQNKDFSM